MAETVSARWSIADSTELYEVERWGKGYFRIASDGSLRVRPNRDCEHTIDIKSLVDQLQVRGLDAPVLLRFNGLLKDRLRRLNEVFQNAIHENDYKGKYCCVYPIKVNQQRSVVQKIVEYGQPYGFGLEAGSKPELLAVVAITSPETPVICNGFPSALTPRTNLEHYAFGYFIEKQIDSFICNNAMTAAHTGARKSELIRSEKRDIDFNANVLTLREKKRSRGRLTTRTVPISDSLRTTLEAWLQQHPGGRQTFCLNNPFAKSNETPQQLSVHQAQSHFQTTLTGKWKNVKGWHVLRHSFASNCAARGIDQQIINAWMGHQTEEMVRRYRHLIPSQHQAAIRTVFS